MITPDYDRLQLQLITTYFTPPTDAMIVGLSSLGRSGCNRSVTTAAAGDHDRVVLHYFGRRVQGGAVWASTIQLLC